MRSASSGRNAGRDFIRMYQMGRYLLAQQHIGITAFQLMVRQIDFFTYRKIGPLTGGFYEITLADPIQSPDQQTRVALQQIQSFTP